MATHLEVASPNVKYSDEEIVSQYKYTATRATVSDGKVTATPVSHDFTFRTKRKVPKMGLMLVGWGGNNGTTVTASILANKHKMTWQTKDGEKHADYLGSLTQSSTVKIGDDAAGKEIHVPFKSLLPMVEPNDLILGGWDISSKNLADACARAQVLDWNLQEKLKPHMEGLVPLPSIYYPSFIASNQDARADNLIEGTSSKQEDLDKIRKDIRDFKEANNLDSVIVLWTANTERFVDVKAGLNSTADEMLASIAKSAEEVSPSNVFAVASILEGAPFINGSPQNTLVPGIIELAGRHNVFIGGDDFKSGQTKMKSVLVDFLVSAGLKPTSIVSYNHLGNNDGKNLSAPAQFRSKEISKSDVVNDMVGSNAILYKQDEHPDHVVVIKYVPNVGDSKRAMDEYTSKIFMNGTNTIVMHNTCEDSLLASPLILDLAILTELMTRISYKTGKHMETGSEEHKNESEGEDDGYQSFLPVLSILSYFLKAPMVMPGTPIINSLPRQHRSLVNIFRACIGLAPEHDMLLEHKTHFPSQAEKN